VSEDGLCSPKTIKRLMKKYGVSFNKRLGQNFLIDNNVIGNIIERSGITAGDAVLEIGPGAGALTAQLAKRAGKVVAVEIDRGFVSMLSETMANYPNVEIINGDILKLNIKNLITEKFDGRPPYIISNLPYYISTPIIMSFFENDVGFVKMVLMVQKEVGERMNAAPGGKHYGVLSVVMDFYCDSEILFDVSRNSFMPPPSVDSAVIALTRREKYNPIKTALFFKVVRAAFSQKRKTLINSLCNTGGFGIPKNVFEEILGELGIDLLCRGETLTTEQFCRLSDKISLFGNYG